MDQSLLPVHLMPFPRRFLPLVGAIVAILSVSAAHASGFTSEDTALSMMRVRAAPLALSGNGEWVIYLDRKNILHRQHVNDPARTQSLPMPVKTSFLAASASGERVAFVAGIGCIGWVDFSSAGALAAGVHWMNGMHRNAPEPNNGWASAPGMQACDGGDAVALSQDGRLLVTPSQQVELDTGKVRANPLPLKGTVFKLQLIDHDRKLLVAHAVLGEFYEDQPDPSRLYLSVWALRDQTLRRLISDQEPWLISPQAFFVDYSPRMETLYWVNTAYSQRDRAASAERTATISVMRQSLAACDAKPAVLFSLKAWERQSMVVDPHGHWIAGVRGLVDTRYEKGEGRDVDELTVIDLATHRVRATFRSKTALRGLVATPDGTALYALASDVWDEESSLNADHGGDLVRFPLGLAAGAAPAAPAWDNAPCPIDGETAATRAVATRGPQLAPAWSTPLHAPQQAQPRMLDEQSMADREATAFRNCSDPGQDRGYMTRDGAIWVDRFTSLARLDPRTGRDIASYPTPRDRRTCSSVAVVAGGFISTRGDTVRWRPFGPDGVRHERVIDRRRGWFVSSVALGRKEVLVYWWARPETPTVKDRYGNLRNVNIAVYSVPGLRHRVDHGSFIDAEDAAGSGFDPSYRDKFRAPCTSGEGAPLSGYDWRTSDFGTLRAHRCTGRKSSDTSRPPPVAFWTASGGDIVAADGAIGVAQVGTTLHIYDIDARREVGRIAIPQSDAPPVVSVNSNTRQVLVGTASAAGMQLRAYALPR